MKLRRNLIASAVVACGLLATSSAFAGNGQNLLQYLPQNAAVVIHVNIEQVRSLPLYQMVWGAVTASSEVQSVLTEMQAQAGFDPNTDISGMTIMLSGESEDHWGLLVEGNFDPARIGTYLATVPAEELSTLEHQGHTVYYDPSEPEAQRGYFTFLSNNVVAAGTQQELDGILGTTTGGANLTANATLNTLVSGTDMSGAFWFAGVMTPAMQSELVGSPMEGMTHLNGSGNFQGGLNVNYTLGTVSAEQATAMSAFFNQQIAQARTSPEVAQMGLTSVLDMVNIANADNAVNISVSVPEQTLNQLIGIVTALMAAEAGGPAPGMAPPTPAPTPAPTQTGP